MPSDSTDILEDALGVADRINTEVDKHTLECLEGLDEDEFFSNGNSRTVVSRYDMEKNVPTEKKGHFVEEDRYWVDEPYSFISLFHSTEENEVKYYVMEPYLNEVEEDIIDFLNKKLKTAIKYGGEDTYEGSREVRENTIEEETKSLLVRYDLIDENFGENKSLGQKFKNLIGMSSESDDEEQALDRNIRPEEEVVEEENRNLSKYQFEKILYYLKRDFVGYEKINPIKNDINVEDISCDGYNTKVFVYHGDYEQIITNVEHGKESLDDFVIKLAQLSGKGISKRKPQVDATLPDGSRAQLTLGYDVSDHGTNYTIRQFNDVPFTPVDLINWNTFGLRQMAFLWLAIENNKSMIFAGGTASGKTTSLNAISLFIPSSSKIVSIEDTREVELPQRNWVASVTRPSFSGDEEGEVDEFDLLEAALRQRPEYIVMGEVRGEEGRDLFQVMSTGHTSYSTFHADSVGEVLKRFTTEPINVSKTLFTALDLVSIQTQTRVNGKKVRRNNGLTEVRYYDPENDEINVQDIYEWDAQEDEFNALGRNNTVMGTETIEDIKFDRGWDYDRVWQEVRERAFILSYLIKERLNTYTQVAATLQAFINDKETTLSIIADGTLEESLQSLRKMESVHIDIDEEDEELVPRPEPSEEVEKTAEDILAEADEIFGAHEGIEPTADLYDEVKDSEEDTAEEVDLNEEVLEELDEEALDETEGNDFSSFGEEENEGETWDFAADGEDSEVEPDQGGDEV